MEWGEKEMPIETGRLQMHSTLTALLPPGCLRVLGKAVLTKTARARVRASVRVSAGGEKYCSSWSRAGKELPRDRWSAKIGHPSHDWES